MSTLRVQLLGEFRLSYAAQLITAINQARLQSLLAYLVLHCHAPQTRQHVAFLFWPDSSEAQAYSNLRKALHTLRSALVHLEGAGDRFLFADAKVVQWLPDAPFVLDVMLFEQYLAQADRAVMAEDMASACALLQQAVDLYAGALLPGCYDDWIAPERERLRERFLAALARLSDLFEQARDYPAAIRHANRLLHADPLHEESYRRLMRLHVRDGDRASALRTYHTCVGTLQRELGVDPSPPTREAYAHLLQLDMPPDALPPEPDKPQQSKRKRAVLIGRQAEWQRLVWAWQQAAHGHAYLVWVAGEPGIGKTRLLEEFARWVKQEGFATAYTRAYAAEGRLAYDPIVEWLRSEPLKRRCVTLEDIWFVEIARLAPELLANRANLLAPQPLTESWQRRRFFEALARAFLAVPEPLLLLLDDLQWCDRETLEWLHYLLRFDLDRPLLIVGAARPGEIDTEHPLQTLLRALRQTEQLIEFELTPLTAHETAQLAQQIAEQAFAPAQMAAIYRVTEGNPLFVQELVQAETLWERAESAPIQQTFARSPQSPSPAKIQAVIEARLAQLSPAGRDLARLAAIIGRAFTFDLLVQASGADKDDVVRALDELWQRRIVREDGAHAYDFSHDRIRDVAYGEISPVWRRQLHRQVATALEQSHASALDTVSAALAFHYAQAGLLEQALTYYQRAAQAAEVLLAYSEAIRALQHGLALLKLLPATRQTKGQELDLLIALGHLLRTTKGFAAREVAETYHRALALCRQLGTESQRYWVGFGLCMYYLNRSEFRLARQFAADNLLLTQELQDQEKRQYAYESMGLIQLPTAEFAAALTQFEQALALPVRHRMRSEQMEVEVENALLPVASAHCLWLLGYPDQARQRMQQTLTILQRHPDPIHIVGDLDFVFMVQHFLHDIQGVRRHAQEIATIATKYSIPMFQAVGMLYTGFVRAQQGETSAGIAQLRRGLDLVRQTDVMLYLPFYLALLAEAYGLAEQNAEALAALDEASVIVNQTGETWWQAELLRRRGVLRLATGAPASEVEACYQGAIQVARQQSAKSLELRATTSLSRLWQAQGKRQAAYDLLAPLYGWFTEGFDTLDMREAQALLAALTV